MWVDALLAVLGGALVLTVLDAAIRTFVLPRASVVLLTTLVFRSIRRVFEAVARRERDYEGRDRVLAGYAPLALLTLPVVWLASVLVGFTAVFHAVEGNGWEDAVVTSGSSLLTLGFEHPDSLAATLLAFAEATIGLALLALLIAYLPTIYGAFSRRELAVTQLAVRAGSPPTAWELLERAHLAGYLDQLDDYWARWEQWFVELEETHTSLGVLPFFRSPNPHRSWITASGAVLDAASLRYALLNVQWTPAAGLCIRSGYLALREIADFFGIEHDDNPHPGDPISIAREEFDGVYERLATAGLPVRPDRERAWRDYAGWRVNYDRVLLAIAGLVGAPFAPWSSDRSTRVRPRYRRARLLH